MAEAVGQTTPRNDAPRGRSQQRGGRRDDRRNSQTPETPKEFEEVVINIDRVARVVKGGRRFRFKALVVVGNRKNKVGVGVAKGADVQTAIAKATDVAKKHLIIVPIINETIPHDMEVKLSGARVLIKPAAPGTGIIAGGVVRSVIGVTGVRNMVSKSLGSTNKVNIAYATIDALAGLVPKEKWLNAKKTVKKPTVNAEAPTEVKPIDPPKTVKEKVVTKKPTVKKPTAKKEAK
ncbi:30S ribosomal protein S5 [Candidatus Saccharibacteria bacterium]|nr:30S ribosomal protein S5 [Candidatus Saccharibacteria bacterium]